MTEPATKRPSSRSGQGLVSLVGAGPGVRDHLTLRALDRLERADLVLYDALVDPSLLELAPNARRFYVGKRAGRHAMKQRTIEALLVRHGRAGKRVVRLKAGDPLVLGRGGEEALALEAAGVPYEIVPGLSSALTAPAFAGVPVTHRGLASNFAMISGHVESAFGPAIEGIDPTSGMTLVILMGFGRRERIRERLLHRGWPGETPAVLIAGAGTAQQSVWRGSLLALGAEGFDPGDAPITMVIGETAALGATIAGVPPVDLPRVEEEIR